MNITGVILAAGSSSRMGNRNKLLLEFRGHTVLQEVLKRVSDSKVDDILVITGHERSRIERSLKASPPGRFRTVYNSNHLLCRAESIKCAIRNIASETEAAMFMVGDKPGVTSTLMNKAIEHFNVKRPAILYVQNPAGRGHPIIFSRAVFDDLMQLQGDFIDYEVLDKYATRQNGVIALEDPAIQINVNTERDYLALLQQEREG